MTATHEPTQAQLLLLRQSIDASTEPVVIQALLDNQPGVIQSWYNFTVSDTYVWKSNLTEHDIVSLTSETDTTWDWDLYMALTQAQRDAWARIFNGTFSMDPSIAHTRQGIVSIFSGASNAPQRQHLLALAVRIGTEKDKVFASGGAGTIESPHNIGLISSLTTNNVIDALALVI